MKKVLLCLFTFVAMHLYADVTTWVTFDFQSPADMRFDPPLSNLDLTYLNGTGDVLNVTNKVIYSGDASMSFGQGTFKEGVAINHVVSEEDESFSFYSLSLRTNATLTISVPESYTLDSIVFEGAIATLSKAIGDPGAFYPTTKSWSPNGDKAYQVSFQNGQHYDTRITAVRVKYTRPAIPLVLESSTPAAGDVVDAFQSMLLLFNTPVVDTLTTAGIQMTSFGIPSQGLKATFADNSVKLSLSKPITSSGPYTVKIPAGCFVNDEGSVNSDISIRFSARIPLVYDSIAPDPAESYRSLSDTIRLFYPSRVLLAKNAFGMLFRGEENLGIVEVSQEGSFSSEVILHLTTGAITEEGVYTVFIPEGSIHNTYYREDDDNISEYDSWNEDITLTYTVKIPVLPEMIAAKELILSEGIGYPAMDSESRLALEAVIAKGEEATAEELTEAMAAFYNDTDVELPADSLWYHIVGVNNADVPSKVYLKYENDSVRLTRDAAEASPFQAIPKDGIFVFRTPDKKHFLHVLTNREDLTKMSASNVTEDETFVNQLTVAKLAMADVDSTLTFGKLSITGVILSLQMGDDDMALKRDTMTVAINHASTTIVDSEKGVLYFDAQLSSAFTFEASDAPFDPDLYVYPEVRIGSDGVIMEGEMLTLTIENVQAATLVNPEYPYFLKNGERIDVEGGVLTATETPNVFIVNTSSLPVGNYIIMLPLGTFSYEKLDKEVIDTEMMTSFVVNKYVEPDPEFQYTYNSQFGCLQTILRIQQGVSIVPDIALNDFVLFANIGNPYTGMVPDETKIVEVQDFYSGKLFRKGHFVPYPDLEKDYPELNLINVQAIKLILDEPFKFGDIPDAVTVAYVIPRGTFGDANFGQWLQNHNSISPRECIVNERIDDMTVLVYNVFYQGISSIASQPADNTIYDLQGRRVTTPSKPGVYVVNGQKRVVK